MEIDSFQEDPNSKQEQKFALEYKLYFMDTFNIFQNSIKFKKLI